MEMCLKNLMREVVSEKNQKVKEKVYDLPLLHVDVEKKLPLL